jgi:hypothetical protein
VDDPYGCKDPFPHSQNRPVLGLFNLPFARHKDRPCFEQSLRGRGGYVPYDATSLWLFSSLQLRLLTSPQSSWILHRASSVRFLLRSCSGSGGTWATTWCCHMLWSFLFCCVSMERSVIDFDRVNPVRVFFFSFHRRHFWSLIDSSAAAWCKMGWMNLRNANCNKDSFLFFSGLRDSIRVLSFLSCFVFSVCIYSCRNVFWNRLHLGRFCLSCKQKTMSKFYCHRIGLQHY